MQDMKIKATLESIATFTKLEKEMLEKSSFSVAVFAVIMFWHILGYQYIDERD